jgi:hypothetical protein
MGLQMTVGLERVVAPPTIVSRDLNAASPMTALRVIAMVMVRQVIPVRPILSDLTTGWASH